MVVKPLTLTVLAFDMSERANIEGVIVPLFDRLREAKSAHEPQSLRVCDWHGLRASVQRELEDLFNTRSPTPVHLFAERELTVIDYGIPDLTAFYPTPDDGHARLAMLLTRAVEAFEPRLKRVQVSLMLRPDHPQGLLVQLSAILAVGTCREPVHFKVTLSHGDGGESQVRDA